VGLSQRRASILGRLSIRRQREREALVLVEGLRAVIEALDAGARARFAVVSDRLGTTEAGRGVEQRLEREGIETDVLADAEFAALASTESPQGVLLVCEQEESELATMVANAGPMLVLDALQDPGNVGTLIRSAVAFGFKGVVALDGTADPWSSKVVRASSGTVFRTSLARAATSEALATIQASGRVILVAAADGELVERSGGREIALVIGNEGAGVRDEIRTAADGTVSVGMSGPVESLNAGIAGSILMHELTRE